MKSLILILIAFHFSLYGQNDVLVSKIDSIISSSIKLNAFPGAQIVILKDGEEIINKSYGYYTLSLIHI